MSDTEMRGTSAAAVNGSDDVESGTGRRAAAGGMKSPRSALSVVAASAVLLATSAGGAALLIWWAVHFHPDDEQTWMVPVGLVLFGTPIVAWFSVFASDFARSSEGSSGMVNSDSPSGHDVVVAVPTSSMAAARSSPAGVVAGRVADTNRKNGR